MALGGDAGGESDSKSRLFVRAKCATDICGVGFRSSTAAMHIDDAGDAGAEQPAIADERAQIRIRRPHAAAAQDPRFQLQVGHTMLRTGDTVAVMVGVDETGQHGHPVGAQDRRAGMGIADRIPGADLADGIALD